MPTYDYDCEVCGHMFELFHSITAAPADKCPQCGGAVKRRIHGGVGLIFKGSGFYLTDYKKSAKTTAEGKAEAGGEKAAAGSKPAGDKPSDKSPGDPSKNSAPSSAS